MWSFLTKRRRFRPKKQSRRLCAQNRLSSRATIDRLPPTPFFQALGEDEEDDWPDPNVLESLLQEAAVVLPSVRLMWHYRSRHEALLDFPITIFMRTGWLPFPMRQCTTRS